MAELAELGHWYTAVPGNEGRGDQCGCCGQPILEGEKFYSWSFKIGLSGAGKGKGGYPLRTWVFLHKECLLNLAEEQMGVTDAQFELYRSQIRASYVASTLPVL